MQIRCRFKCNMCPASSTDESIIKIHKNRHWLNKPVSFWCNFCATEFPKESTFANHVLSVHHKESEELSQAHKCSSCHRVFSLKSTALIHFLMKCAVHPIPNSTTKKCAEEVFIRYVYVCEFCWKGFAFISCLNDHRNHEHSDKIAWNAETSIGAQEKNERIMDIFGIKHAFACKFCAYIFISLDNYIYHLKEHSDELYKCTTCDETFPLYGNFKTHRETKHDYRVVFRETNSGGVASSIPCEEQTKKDNPERSSSCRLILGRSYNSRPFF